MIPGAAISAQLAGWAYPGGTDRDLRLDFLRGFAVFAMVVDHLAGPSRLYLLTGGNRFYTSAAEGFVFISGLLAGVVYCRMAQRRGLSAALRRLLARAWTLYLLTIALTLVVIPISEVLNLPWAEGLDRSDPAGLLWSILTLHQSYYLVDIPLLYALLLAIAPLALFLLCEGRWWVVLGGSWALWLGHQLFPGRADLPWPIAGNYLFYFAAWQVLFFTGMVLGFHQDRVQRIAPPSRWPALLLATGAALVGMLGLFRYTEPILRALASGDSDRLQPRAWNVDLIEVLFAKGDVRVGRIVASALVFAFVLLFTTQFWKPLSRLLGWLFIPLGRHALYAYSAHIAVALAMGIATVHFGLRLAEFPTASALIQVVSLLLIWACVRLRVLYPSQQQQRWWNLSPAVLAAVFVVVAPIGSSPLSATAEAGSASAPQADRAARVFGTPLPRVQRETSLPAAQPLPKPPPRPPGPLPGGEPRASEYVGDLHGTFRDLQFYSPTLDSDMRYLIYLPPGYSTPGRRYPLLLMLHGASAEREEWAAYGLIDTVDDLIYSLEIRPMIVVLPQGDESYFVNHVDGDRWGDYIARDLIRHLDASFRTIPEPTRRAVGGLSMGGWGALHLAFAYQDTFRAVGAHSPSLRFDEEFQSILGEGSDFESRDPFSLARTARGLRRLQIWLDLGEEDPWLDRLTELHLILAERGIPHEFHVQPGDHDGEYWRANAAQYLRFYDRALYWRDAG